MLAGKKAKVYLLILHRRVFVPMQTSRAFGYLDNELPRACSVKMETSLCGIRPPRRHSSTRRNHWPLRHRTKVRELMTCLQENAEQNEPFGLLAFNPSPPIGLCSVFLWRIDREAADMTGEWTTRWNSPHSACNDQSKFIHFVTFC